jgi:hypothetical protein
VIVSVSELVVPVLGVSLRNAPGSISLTVQLRIVPGVKFRTERVPHGSLAPDTFESKRLDSVTSRSGSGAAFTVT